MVDICEPLVLDVRVIGVGGYVSIRISQRGTAPGRIIRVAHLLAIGVHHRQQAVVLVVPVGEALAGAVVGRRDACVLAHEQPALVVVGVENLVHDAEPHEHRSRSQSVAAVVAIGGGATAGVGDRRDLSLARRRTATAASAARAVLVAPGFAQRAALALQPTLGIVGVRGYLAALVGQFRHVAEQVILIADPTPFGIRHRSQGANGRAVLVHRRVTQRVRHGGHAVATVV